MTADCTRIDTMAEELALGMVDEPERGDLLTHVDGCPRCRALLDDLSATADQVLLIAPEAEPPVGFEARAVAAMDPGPDHVGDVPSRRRRWVTIAAAAAIVVVVGGVGVGIGRASSPADARARALDRVDVGNVAAAPLTSADGTRVGGAIVLGGARPSLWMSLDDAEPGERYLCQVVLADGTRHVVGVWSPKGPGRTWSVELDQLHRGRAATGGDRPRRDRGRHGRPVLTRRGRERPGAGPRGGWRRALRLERPQSAVATSMRSCFHSRADSSARLAWSSSSSVLNAWAG